TAARIAPAQPRAEISEPRIRTEGRRVIAETVCGARICARRILPFGLRRQSIGLSSAALQPRHISLRLVPADANNGLRSLHLETRLEKRCLWRTPDDLRTANVDHHMAQVAHRHFGVRNEGGKLVNRHFEFSDCNSPWDNNASGQP